MRTPPIPLLLLGAACSQDVNISDKLQNPPHASITAPADGDVYSELDAIDFVGVVEDAQGLDDVAALAWASDLDGPLADHTAAPLDQAGLTRFAATLSPGTHAITLTATDLQGLTAVASVSITVELAAYEPVAEITVPQPFAMFDAGDDIQLVGAASDPNQPPDTLTAVWEAAPLDDETARVPIASGPPSAAGSTVAVWSGAPIGRYRLVLTVIDDDGNEAEATVTIEVVDPNAGDADGDGWTVVAGDCDDADPEVAPGRDEVCDGKDNDCNQVIDDKDLDSDRHVDQLCELYPGPDPRDDCDDADGTVFPGAAEQADGVDNDCDGEIDDGLSVFDNDGDCFCTALTCTGSVNPSCAALAPGDCDDTDPLLNPVDADGDGASTCAFDCDDGDPQLNPNDADADGFTTCGGDCDDGDPWFNPGDVDRDGASTCAGDCDDEDASLNLLDADADGASTCAGDCNDGAVQLNLLDADGDGWTTCAGDCNDGDALVSPVDGDGDGASACAGDCNDADPALNVQDDDGDGYSTCAGDCDDADDWLDPQDTDGDGASTCAGDCDDLTAALDPYDLDGDGASSCAGDCADLDPARNLVDADGDGFHTCAGDCDDTDPALDAGDDDGDGFSTCAGDCDDGNGALDPADADMDGFSSCAGDCDDFQASVRPGAPEVAYNGVDDDCAGGDLRDVDADGYDAAVVGGTDCDDTDAQVNPGGLERCNGVDDDCDGQSDEINAIGCTLYYRDYDGDGYGTTSSRCQCAPNPATHYDATNSSDCYDASADARPGQTTYFYDHRGDGSWDYNCDGVETKIDNRTTVYDCEIVFIPTFPFTDCIFTQGWETAPPDCGETENWGGGCYWALQCDPYALTPVDQRCR